MQKRDLHETESRQSRVYLLYICKQGRVLCSIFLRPSTLFHCVSFSNSMRAQTCRGWYAIERYCRLAFHSIGLLHCDPCRVHAEEMERKRMTMQPRRKAKARHTIFRPLRSGGGLPWPRMRCHSGGHESKISRKLNAQCHGLPPIFICCKSIGNGV